MLFASISRAVRRCCGDGASPARVPGLGEAVPLPGRARARDGTAAKPRSAVGKVPPSLRSTPERIRTAFNLPRLLVCLSDTGCGDAALSFNAGGRGSGTDQPRAGSRGLAAGRLRGQLQEAPLGLGTQPKLCPLLGSDTAVTAGKITDRNHQPAPSARSQRRPAPARPPWRWLRVAAPRAQPLGCRAPGAAAGPGRGRRAASGRGMRGLPCPAASPRHGAVRVLGTWRCPPEGLAGRAAAGGPSRAGGRRCLGSREGGKELFPSGETLSFNF